MEALKHYKCVCFEDFKALMTPWLCKIWRIFDTCLQNITEKVRTNHSVDTEVLVKFFPLGYSSDFF